MEKEGGQDEKKLVEALDYPFMELDMAMVFPMYLRQK